MASSPHHKGDSWSFLDPLSDCRGSEPGGPQALKAEEISRVFPMTRSLRDKGKMTAHLLPASWAKMLLRVIKRGRRTKDRDRETWSGIRSGDCVQMLKLGFQIRVKGLGQSLRSEYQIRRLG